MKLMAQILLFATIPFQILIPRIHLFCSYLFTFDLLRGVS